MNKVKALAVSGCFGTWPQDVLASVVVFLVALPLCMGIALASGLPPEKGILSGIIGGLIVGCFSGCPLQISGPAAGLAVVVLELIKEHGIEALGAIIIVAGVVQTVAGLTGLAQWFRAVPPSVINGMLSGIGVLIFSGQFHVMIDDAPKGSGINNIISIPLSAWKALVPDAEKTHHLAAAIGVLTIVSLLAWEKLARGRLKVLPGSLVAVVIATAVAAFMNLPIRYVQIPDNIWQSIRLPAFSDLNHLKNWELLADGVAVALIAAAETLLTATALDKLHRGVRTNYDRELLSQGIGNILCGFVGALPMTGVMVRSGVNLNAGARTRLSAILHGFWLLLCVVFLASIIRMIPTSSLAALLVYTGYKLCNFKVYKDLLKFGRGEVIIYAATLGCIVSVDLLTGVLVGVGMSIAKLLYIFSHLEIRVAEDPATGRTDLWLKGAATFLSLPRFATAIEKVSPESELHVHLDALDYIDHACLDHLMSWEQQHQATGGSMVIDWGALGSVFRDRRGRSRGGKTKELRRFTKELMVTGESKGQECEKQ